MDNLRKLLAGAYRDPDTGETLRVPMKALVIEATLAGREAELVKALDLPKPFAILSDDDTYAALGQRVETALASLGEIIPIRLGKRPHPDDETAARVMREGERAGAYIAVGSGSICDLAKYSAARQGKRCAVFATAPSMNGYTSVNAAITVRGHKKSLAAISPDGVFVDLDVLAKAPKRLIQAGFGDAICRSTAQADWLMSSRLLGQTYRTVPFAFIADLENQLVTDPGALLKGDRAALSCLIQILLLSGFGMTICGGSYPASQGEHLISHHVEMMPPQGWEPALHGEQIAVTTIVMAKLQDQLLARDRAPHLEASKLSAAALKSHFGDEVGAACWQDIQPKLADGAKLAGLNERLQAIWPGLKSEIELVRRPAAVIDKALAQVEAPRRYPAIGLPRAFFKNAILHAREIRNRYTFLDLAADSGLLEPERLID
ncbi:sn-glycerol-1-phosphate dehydrogenase [Nordella sp. HKS 07]|uniref:iron-containing alcohol dehydrogenase n=1 Tax=Nordella sp. HKS 07 TaxID=2712222 RepID=UPI0013E1523B|nr:iron-containing alcohol dehydrogenase [Nordella sp. HKS 07]QIG46550.1 sn-glycerol-1-phosphate dehydrogenase [Nordella sp. HKS 07]